MLPWDRTLALPQQIYVFIMYIYMCVCVCVCVCIQRFYIQRFYTKNSLVIKPLNSL